MTAATHTLESIQAAFLSSPTPILTSHTILLGHSLECDLAALKIRHPLCIDTALIFRHPRGPPYKPGLKWLTNKWLGREIQGAASGHDSEEDATACVDLLKLKMANGVLARRHLFIVGQDPDCYEVFANSAGPEFGNLFDNTEPIFDRMARLGSQQGKVNKTSAYCDYFNMRGGLSARATTAVKCTSHDFVFGRLMELANVQGCEWRSS
jgi:RNA exonuclease 1